MRPQILLFLLLIPSAFGQTSEAGCTQMEPCEWTFDVGAEGFDDGSVAPAWNFTVGDWVILDVFNSDDVTHTVTLGEKSWTVESLSFIESDPFQFTEAAELTLYDEPSGDAAPVSIIGDEFIQNDEAAQTSPKGIPSVGFAATLGLLGLAAVASRRLH